MQCTVDCRGRRNFPLTPLVSRTVRILFLIRRIELINNIGPCPKLHVATSPRRDFSSIVANSSLYIRYIHPISIVRNFSHQFLQFSFTFDTKTIPLPCVYILFQIIFPNNFYLLFLGEKSGRKKSKEKEKFFDPRI